MEEQTPPRSRQQRLGVGEPHEQAPRGHRRLNHVGVWVPFLSRPPEVPLMLLAFGVSLRVDPLPGKGSPAAELWFVQAVKLLLQPLFAYGLATWVFKLDAHSVLAVTLLASLPTATVVHIVATRYRTAEQLARDSVLWSTVLCVPVVVAISGLLR